MAAAFVSIAVASKKKKPPKNCELKCNWNGYGCDKSPWYYDCNDEGRFTMEKWNQVCEVNCWCGCDSAAQA